MNLPSFPEHTAIATMYGYELYCWKEKPWVIHRYTVRIKDENGVKRPEKRVEHMELDGEGWGDTKVATAVRAELKKLWADWVEWQQVMREAKEREAQARG